MEGLLLLIRLVVSSAYDKVNRRLLWTKMFEKGINCKIIRVIKAYYESSQMKVQKGNEHSNIFKTSVGVIQGGALSPELYSCYAEGFFKDIEKTNTGIW